MAYVSLYRKYRPQTFTEIVGQEHVTRSLVNALTDDRLHHAYLFTGPRGTGKTSTARILAKSVNCVDGPTPAPCNECEQCVAITQGTSVDVIELDMASHGGVDDARELRDRARFSPASARRKVYILDEVHMASNAAFNALLKLIEEPPDHVLFAMATTDPQKVLPTIMSRVQRLDLRRVGAADVAGRVVDLVGREGGTIDQAAVDAVVRAGDGSIRDTESVLEQVLSYADQGNVTGTDVEEVLGKTPFESTAAVVDAMVRGDLVAGFATVQDLLDRGTDLRVFATDLVGHVRDLLVLVVAPDRVDLVDATEERRTALADQAAGLSARVLTDALQALGAALDAMRKGEGARLAVELAIATVVAETSASSRPADSDQLSIGTATRAATGVADDSPQEATDTSAHDAPAEPADLGETLEGTRSAGVTDGAPATDDDAVADDATGDDASGDEGDEAAGHDEGENDDEDGEGEDGEEGDGEDVDDDEGDEDGDVGAGDDPVPGNDLAARATARGEQVARDGMPQPTATRPEGPAVERDLPPEPDEVAQLDLIQSRWPAVLELVRADNVKAEAMLKEARPTRLRRRVLRLSYPASRGFHARAVASQEFDAVVIPAIERTCDVTVRLEVDVDGESAGGGGPKHREPATTTSPADLAAARAAASSSGSSATGDDLTADAPNADGQSSSSTAAEGRGDGAGSLEANPMADLDPAAAMDRAAASLVDQLGATEVDVETP